MDQSSLVDYRIEEGLRFVARFAADGNPVRAAFWMKIGEEAEWYLIIATEMFDSHGSTETYRAVQSTLKKLARIKISISEIKVVSVTNPVVKDVSAFTARFPNHTSTQFGSEPAYIYPPDTYSFSQGNPMTTEDIGIELVRLMNRGNGTLQPTQVTMKDGTTFNGVPFSLGLGSQKAVVAQFVADGEAAPRVIRLDEISSIA